MAMPDTTRPEDENEPEDFGDREPYGNGNEGDDDPFELETDGDPLNEDYAPADDNGQPDQLELVDEDASLPWLEGDDEDEQESGGSGQIVLLALLALAALGLILGGIWWFSRDSGKDDLIADGSLIEAPDQPYKEKPADPGGKTFEGTGDTSYAVSEGETRQARLGQDSEPPKPGFETVPAPTGVTRPAASENVTANQMAPKAATPAPVPAATRAAANASPSPAVTAQPAQASAPSGPAVQVGAYSSRAQAEAGWSKLTGSHAVLSGLRYRIVEGKADIGTVYRLQALPGDMAAARALCAKLKAARQDCNVKD